MHTHPVQTSSSNTTNRPTRTPAAGSTIFKGIVALSKAGEHVEGDKYLVFVEQDMLNTFVVFL